MLINVTVTYYSVISVTRAILYSALQLHHEGKEDVCNMGVTTNGQTSAKHCNTFCTITEKRYNHYKEAE
jgi:hypothetical protein